MKLEAKRTGRNEVRVKTPHGTDTWVFDKTGIATVKETTIGGAVVPLDMRSVYTVPAGGYAQRLDNDKLLVRYGHAKGSKLYLHYSIMDNDFMPLRTYRTRVYIGASWRK